MVPVTNLVFRLSYKGPSYQRRFADEEARSQGLPFEKRDEYIKRSPVFHVDKLKVPLLVHVATNDTDVNFVENQQIVDALRSREAGSRRDEDLRQSGTGPGVRRPHLQPPRSTRKRSSATTRPTRSTHGIARGRSSSGTCGPTGTNRNPPNLSACAERFSYGSDTHWVLSQEGQGDQEIFPTDSSPNSYPYL